MYPLLLELSGYPDMAGNSYKRFFGLAYVGSCALAEPLDTCLPHHLDSGICSTAGILDRVSFIKDEKRA